MKAMYHGTLDFIERYYAAHGLAPSVREMTDALRLSSTSLTNLRVSWLLKQGYVEKVAGIQRSMRVTMKGYSYLNRTPNTTLATQSKPRANAIERVYLVTHKSSGIQFTITHDCADVPTRSRMIVALTAAGFRIVPIAEEKVS